MTDIHVHESGSVVAAVGDAVVIHLENPAATGYQWSPLVTGAAVVEESTEVVHATSGAPGASGEWQMVLRASEPGSAHAAFDLVRAWEPTAPIDHVDLEIQVEP